MKRPILYLLTMSAHLGCSGGGMVLDSLDFLKTEPKTQDLVGLYCPDAATRKDIRERGHYPAREISIQLSADGTFTCTNIPDWWTSEGENWGKSLGHFINVQGHWKPVQQQDYWTVGLDDSLSNNFRFPDTSIIIVGAKPPYTLRIYLGDPDERQVMEFIKQEESHAPTVKTPAGSR